MIKYPAGSIVVLPDGDKAEVKRLLWSKEHLEYWLITNQGTFLESEVIPFK